MRVSAGFVSLTLLVACSGGAASSGSDLPPLSPTGSGDELFRAESLPAFGSQAELEAYMAGIEDDYRAGDDEASSGASGAEGAGAGSSGSGSAPPANENITNNQEAGVDEGGIVKNIGDHLVILRKGRLYAVNVSQGLVQTSTIAVAPTDALNNGVWYDEMLVKGDRLYVIGYRYTVKASDGTADTPWFGATEVSSFRLTNGVFERLKTLYIESSDYFSGRNYASRLVDGKLVFYMPYSVWSYAGETKKIHFPRYFESRPDGSFTVKEPIFGATDVIMPVAKPRSLSFHTIVKCDLPDSGELACSARAVLADWSREHYVTGTTVFLWTLPNVYAFRFSDLGALAHRADVAPTDQFSFKVHGGKLHVLGRTWSESNVYSWNVRLLSLPLMDFDTKGGQALHSLGRELVPAAANGYVHHNRFVGDKVVAAMQTYVQNSGSETLLSYDIGSDVLSTSGWPGYVTRIEPLGDDRALVATSIRSSDATSGSLALETFDLARGLKSLGKLDLEGMSEGESRSHGFFYKPDANAFGLPVVQPGGAKPNQWYARGLSNIAFFEVAGAGGLATLGAVASSGATGTCETSCIDWYGNTRPIFLKDRTFALMGSELREVRLRPGVEPVGPPLELTR